MDDGSGPREVVDAMSSWWCQIHGYRNEILDQAVTEQLSRFSHVMFGGLTHDPAIHLVERLIDLLPSPLERIFLADSGSVAVEVACKLARQYQLAKCADSPAHRRPPTRFAALRGAYHGDTWGAMGLCDPEGGMHSMYAGSLQEHLFLPRPPAFDAEAEHVDAWIEQVRIIIHQNRDDLVGIVIEPILQGAGGMWPWAPRALTALREISSEYDLLLIADEIAVGFGRTGRLFGCDWAGIVPDVMILGKAMTGGYMTQSAVCTSNAIARTICEGPAGMLMHGPTFMANPLACAVSAASLGLISEGTWSADVSRIEKTMTDDLALLRGHPGVADIRILGAAVAVELAVPLDMQVASSVAVDTGTWLRPFNRLVYAMPPYMCSDDDLKVIAHSMRAVVDALTERSGRIDESH